MPSSRKIIDWDAEDADPSVAATTSTAAPRRPVLEITPDMPLRQRAARAIHNANIAHFDTLFDIEHELAARHFQAVADGDADAAEELLQTRMAMGFDVG